MTSEVGTRKTYGLTARKLAETGAARRFIVAGEVDPDP
jgi:hypothetical protein